MPIRSWILAAAALLCLGAQPAWAEELRPFDEGPDAPGFAAFRDRMVDAVEARDTEFIRTHAATDILLGFGGESGQDALIDRLEADPGLWDELRWVLTHGGAFGDDGRFTAPYTFVADIAMDPFRAGIVTGADVNARASPDLNALVVATLSHEVVEVQEWSLGRDGRWARIAVPGGGHAFMAADFLRSPIDYRARFARRDGTWKMELFVAGD